MTSSKKIPFDKKFLTIAEQIGLLKNRGINFENEANAKHHLRHINYYHLAVYTKFFQESNNCFKPNTTFDHILQLYQFDKKLRSLLLDVLERIEISLKSAITYDISLNKKDPRFWYIDINEFNFRNEKNKKKHDLFMKKTQNCSEDYAKHFLGKYQERHLPIWMTFEALSFGECVKFLSILKENNQQIVSKKYSLPYELNIKFLHRLSTLRNICAHHAWLWNRSFTFTITKKYFTKKIFDSVRPNSLYAYLIVIQIYLAKINPTSSWLDRLKKLIEEYQIPIQEMGFPTDWYIKLNSLIH